MPRFLSPRPSRTTLLAASALLAALLAGAPAAYALKVATWNVLQYQDPNVSFRQPSMRTVVGALDPDVIMLQELLTQAARDSFLINVLGVVQPGQWSAGTFINTAESCVFYKPSRINLTSAGSAIPTSGPRDVLGARIKFPGYVSREAETFLYSVHFKAGTPLPTTSDSTDRRLECTDLRNFINGLNYSVLTRNFLICGDTNFYGTWEGGYVRLTESQADNDGQGFDPLSLPGTWNNSAYAVHETQSTCSSGCPAAYWSAGGLDDRFDLFLTSVAMRDGEGMDLVPGSYVPFGNDGAHFNSSVNGGGFNNAVGLPVATALLNSSDHLPVMVTIQAPAKIAANSQLDFGRVVVGGAPSLALNVSDPATTPADELTYTLTAPAGFTAPSGTLQALAGTGGNVHAIGMDASTVGPRGGTLTIASDAPDSTSKSVLLSGTVIAHAVPSLDSLAIVVADTLDFGAHSVGGFGDSVRCVHNVGWTALQSMLDVLGGPISGGAGRFSIVGGFEPIEIAGTGGCFSLHFDDQGATLDSTYEATLSFTCSDEALPGGTASPSLTVLLRARPTSGVGVGGSSRLPDRVAFLPPRPNPFRHDVDLSLELPRDGNVSLEAFDLSGRRVAGILEGPKPAGRYTVHWKPADDSGAPLRAGLYLVRLQTPGFSRTRRVVLLP
jgi:hypothetical protein